MGLEPTTTSLEGWSSTTELRPPESSTCNLIPPGLTFYILSLVGSREPKPDTITRTIDCENHDFLLPVTLISQAGGQERIRTSEA